MPPPANTPYSRWAGCHFFRVLPRKGQGCGPRARKQVSTTTEPSPFRSAGQRRLQTECSKPPGTNAPGISDPASSPPLSETGWLQLGRASPIEATLSNTPFQPVSLPPPANTPYSRWAGCHFFHTLPRKGQACDPRARKQVSTKTEPLPFRAAGQRRLQTKRSKPPGTNAPGISAPANGPPLSEPGGCNWGALLQLKPPFPTRLSSRFLATPCKCAIQPLGGMPLLPRPAPQRPGLRPTGPKAGFHHNGAVPFQICGPASASNRMFQASRHERTGHLSPANGNARKRFTTPCGYATFFIDPFHISKTYRPHKILPSGKIKRLQPCRIPHAKNFRPVLFP